MVTPSEDEVAPVLRDGHGLAPPDRFITIEFSIHENAGLCVDVSLAVVDADAEDVLLVVVGEDRVELVRVVPSIQVDPPLMQIGENQDSLWLQFLLIPDDVGKSVVETRLERSATLDLVVLVLQAQH